MKTLEKITGPLSFLLKAPGLLLGSIICGVFFGIVGMLYGIFFPWLEEEP
jgi:hypothetical protein